MTKPKFCVFCEAEAIYIIKRSGSGICASCSSAYEAGQSNPDGGLSTVEDWESEND